ncbi:predicted protein [Coccidioides posadasii str. Silveira]|uniref:Predicted protein n=2 Tax=Coccidioides posadasii TaxID=199306 RepID=E9D5D5_COCPS|nr:predicted protein [Coccidioides posadasii str. Silveira]KMM66477.1 hypothetical protein CPAG_02816 [Coccidioides posadasii RMSCC 3488]
MADHEEFKKIHWQLRKVLRFGSQRSIIMIIICRSTDNPYLGSRFHYPTENAALCTQNLKSVFQEYRRPFGLSLKVSNHLGQASTDNRVEETQAKPRKKKYRSQGIHDMEQYLRGNDAVHEQEEMGTT